MLDAPTFIAQVPGNTEKEQDRAVFTCQATGEPVPTISWYFNDIPVDVTNTVKYDVLSTMFSPSILSILRINNVQSSDVGTYTCNATNVVSSDTSSGVLTVCGEFTLLCIQLSILTVIHPFNYGIVVFKCILVVQIK